MNSHEVIAKAMRAALAPIASALPELLRKAQRGDAAAVHGARVALRRLRVGTDILAMSCTAFDPGKAHKLAAALRQIERWLGPTRDDDVFAENFRRWLRRKGSTRGAAALQARLVSERQRHVRALARDLKRRPIRHSMKHLRRCLAEDAREPHAHRRAPSKPSLRAIRSILCEEVERSYADVRSREPAGPADFDAIHKLRSSLRSLRFTLELFGEQLSAADAAINILREAQHRLGALHDDVVATARIQRWLARGKVARSATVRDYLACRVRSRDRRRARFNGERRASQDDSLQLSLPRALRNLLPKSQTAG